VPCCAPADSLPADSSTADASSQPDSGGLEEFVVTARKRSEDIQQTPIAIHGLHARRPYKPWDCRHPEPRGADAQPEFQSSPYDSVGSFIACVASRRPILSSPRRRRSASMWMTFTIPPTACHPTGEFPGRAADRGAQRAARDVVWRNTTGGAIKITLDCRIIRESNGEAKVATADSTRRRCQPQ